MIVRIGIVVILIGLAIGGYILISDWENGRRSIEYRKYAGIIAETSIAAELFRSNQDSFFVARDAILKRHNVSLPEMDSLYTKFEKDWPDAAEFWKYVADITDSLVKIQDSILKIRQKDASRDSSVSTNQE